MGWNAGIYLPMTGDLLPFIVLVLSQGFLGMSEEETKKSIGYITLIELNHYQETKKKYKLKNMS